MTLKPRKIVFWLLALLALAVLAWLGLREPEQMVSAAAVTRGPLEVSFVEEGKTRLKQRYVVTAPVAGTLRRVTLQPGDAVHAGDVLAEIDPATSGLLDPRSRSQAEAEVRAGEAQLAAARERVAAALAAERLAATELKRMQTVVAAGALSRQDLDNARTRAATTAAELAGARADERATGERLAASRALLGGEGRSSPAAGRAKAVAVRAPVDGRVLKRPLESATPVPVGQVLMEIGDPAQLEIEADVLSTDAVRLAPGTPARVLRWGGEGVLQAKVTRVEPGGFTKVSALGVEEQRTKVILGIESPHEQWARLGDAYRVELEFIVQQAQDVLQVPASALFRAGDGWAAYRIDHGRARRTEVQVGLRSATAAQVTGGLEQGQQVIVQPDDRITEGARVRAAGAV